MQQWQFPHGKNLTPTGVNNTAIEIFLDNIADSLTREVIQNSLDAHDSSTNAPVKVEFQFYDIENKTVPGIETLKNFALPKALEMWEEINNEDTLKYLRRFSDTLNKDKIRMLKISDYNTKGLNDKNYRSLVLGNAYTEKDNDSAEGSKGIGKAAPFAASDLRMVFYSTVPTESAPKSAGVMNFVSFEYDDEKQITQERATFFEEGMNHIPNQINSVQGTRKSDEFGTDVYVLGVKQFDEDWADRIRLSVINNFLVSIFNNQLEVSIDNLVINSETLNETMEYLNDLKLSRHEIEEFRNSQNFYDVLTNPERLEFNLDDRFMKYDFIETINDATLFLLQHEPANRTVLQTRKAGMKIYERNRISGNINFSGVFQVTGDKFSSFLRDMENANHNTWSIDRLTGANRRDAEKLLQDLLHFYKEKVKDSYELDSENEIDAFGVSDLLPLQEKNDGSQTDSDDSGVKNTLKNITITKKDSKKHLRSDDGDKDDKFLEKDLGEAGVGEGDGGGFGGGSDGKGGGIDTPTSSGEERGNRGDDPDVDDRKSEKEVKIPSTDILSLKVIGIDPENGKYRIVGNVLKNKEKSEISFKYVGADGKAYSIELKEVSSNSQSVEMRRNSIRITNLSKDDNLNIDFTVNSKLRMKMEGTVYEIKN